MDALYNAHATEVYAFAARRASRSAAEDVVAETFLIAWRRIDAVPEPAKPWLLAVARRVLANQRRADGRRAALTARIGMSEREGDTSAGRERSDQPAVLAALADLSPRDRDAITLIAWDGLRAEEAATVLGCSRATFYVRLHRAKKRLAEALGNSDEHNNDEQEAERS